MQTETKISGFRLSPQQRRLWSLQQNGTVYWTQGAILIEGELQTDLLKQALEQTLDRNDLLRTSFRRLPGMKMPLMVSGDRSLALGREIDLRNLDEATQTAQIEALLQTTRCQGFNTEQDSPLQWSLVRLSAQKSILHLSLPSLYADSRTISILAAQIRQSYEDCIEGREGNSSAVQYFQFSEWHNELLEDEEAEAGKAYWRQQKSSTLSLPFENPSLVFEPHCYKLEINPDLNLKIEAFTRQHNNSIDNLLLACWQTLIWRLTGKSDFTIGLASDRRDAEELHDTIGLIGTWLPLKIHLTPDLSFQTVLERVEMAKVEGWEWQDYFVPEAAEDNSVTFPISFEFQSLPQTWVTAGTSFTLIEQESCLEPFGVKLTYSQSPNKAIAAFYYNVRAFSAKTIQRLAEQFQTLLESAIAHPKLPIPQLDLLSKKERQQLLEFNQTQQDFKINRCIHQVFEEQVARTPNNLAVVFEEQQLTYAQLNAKANQLARYLQRLGIEKESLVGICLERSLEAMVAMLAILKAGVAYLPLDPDLPVQSLNLRIQDANSSLILTHSALTINSKGTVICLDRDWDAIAQESQENLDLEVKPENLAYVLYTSGSTGQPKGVAIEHRQLLNYLYGILERLDLPNPAHFATVSSLATDLGNTVIFPALCTGGCLHVISQERAMNPDAFAQYCDRYPIDCLKIVPSHLNALLSAAEPQKILPKSCLILGGEVLSWQLVEQVRQYAPDCQIFNHYGPTETTVGVLTYRVTPHQEAKTVPIGRPLANTQVYILDEQKQPVPIGVAGELYIGGAGVARGYLHRPQLTAEGFLTNFGESKLYRTGDRVRYLNDGNIEFLGRTDHQVKIRGFRLELEEIETILNQHSGVRQCVAAVWEENLVVYIVPDRAQTPTVRELRDFLKEKLPDYAIPHNFILLKSLPLTPNGKVDRQSLPAPDRLRPELAVAFVPPQNEVEQTLATIWKEMLPVEKVGIHDNFFDLGGHSLLMVQMHSKLRQVFNREIAITDLFKYPTINALAQFLSQGQPETQTFTAIHQRAASRLAAREQRDRLRQNRK